VLKFYDKTLLLLLAGFSQQFTGRNAEELFKTLTTARDGLRWPASRYLYIRTAIFNSL